MANKQMLSYLHTFWWR